MTEARPSKYYFNQSVYCSQCNRLRFMGYTYGYDLLCQCSDQKNIPTYIKMTTEQKIIAIRDAIERAKNHQSKMDQVAWSVPALSSLKIRHLMNNLGAISTAYLECGVHKGGLFCSTIRNNDNIKYIHANDSFESDETSDEKVAPQFFENVNKCKSSNQILSFLTGDTFNVKPDLFGTPIDLYLFDADHSYESQRKAMTHFLPAMADEFILCVDDHNWQDVWLGTHDGLREANVEILFEEAFVGGDHDNDGWWNGFYIALLKKK